MKNEVGTVTSRHAAQIGNHLVVMGGGSSALALQVNLIGRRRLYC